MINNSKDSDNSPLKQEGFSSTDHNHEKAKEPPPPPSSSSQWLRLKDPRIVRVSRAFGGKDRHSKVCTIRGLRDRRVRLSVPTAICLYDLQNKLGLSQPSKVVDWLLNAAKHDIDELPPLPLVPSVVGNNFTLGFPSLGTSSHNHVNNVIWKTKSKEVISGEEMFNDEKKEEGNKKGDHCAHDVLTDSNNSVLLSSRPNNLIPSFLGLVNTIPFGYQWDQNYSQSLSSSGDVVAAKLGNHNHHNGSSDHMHSINGVPFPSNLGGGSQVLVCPPPPRTTTTKSYLPSNNVAAAMEMDPRQMINSHYHQLLMNSVHPSHHQHHHHLMMTMMTSKLFHSANSSEINKDQDFPSK